MTHKESIAYLVPWVGEVANLMQLQDWEIFVGDEPSPEGSCANCLSVHGRKSATIKLASEFTLQKLEDQRHTVVHELVHVHFAFMHNPLADVLRSDTYQFYLSAMEYGVDAMADLIAPSMPLPPKAPK